MVNVETKADLKFSVIVGDVEFRYPKSHCLSYNTFAKMQIQGLIIKKFKSK